MDKGKREWYAIRTKYKAEKHVANNLLKKGIEAYVPLLHVTKRYVRKVKKLQLPLINCYVFVCISKGERVKVLETEYVSRFVSQSNSHLEAIPEEEIKILKRVVGDFQGEIESNPIEWEEGSHVEVVTGNLVGTKGILIKRHNKHQFVIRLYSIGQELRLMIDPANLRKIKLKTV